MPDIYDELINHWLQGNVDRVRVFVVTHYLTLTETLVERMSHAIGIEAGAKFVSFVNNSYRSEMVQAN